MRRWRGVAAAAAAVGIGAGFWVGGMSGRDLSCPGEIGVAFRDGPAVMRTPDEALGSLLDDADHVTHERDDAKGFETVTYRGYDADGELMARVLVEGTDDSWFATRVDTCH